MTKAEVEKAKAIVSSWAWQPAEGQLYRYRYAVGTYTRFYEAPSLQPDEIKLVLDYLQSGETITDVELLGKAYVIGGDWIAKSAWLQTMPAEKWAGTDSTRIRIYQILVKPNADGATGDGPYVIENGVTQKIERTFYWDVKEPPEEPPQAEDGTTVRIENLTRDRETGFWSYMVETRTNVVDGETGFVLEKQHEVEALEHRDAETKIVGKEETVPDFEEIGITDITEGEGESAKKVAKVLTRVSLRTDPTSGSRELRTITETSKPLVEELTWVDDDSAGKVVIFRNQVSLPNVSKNTFTVDGVVFSITSFSPSIAPNKFGLWDGVYTYRHNKRADGTTSSGDYYYDREFDYYFEIERVKPGGRIEKTRYKVTKGVFYGNASTAVSRFEGGSKGSGNMDYPHLGLKRSMQTHGLIGTAVWYKDDLKVVEETGEATS